MYGVLFISLKVGVVVLDLQKSVVIKMMPVVVALVRTDFQSKALKKKSMQMTLINYMRSDLSIGRKKAVHEISWGFPYQKR